MIPISLTCFYDKTKREEEIAKVLQLCVYASDDGINTQEEAETRRTISRSNQKDLKKSWKEKEVEKNEKETEKKKRETEKKKSEVEKRRQREE